MSPVITLLTDFGLSDTYVGQVKGAILTVNPQAVIVDLTHEVGPQQVREGAFLLEAAIGVFPPGTIHVAVVDPGVGSDRRALAVETPHALFVGPDNGILSAALTEPFRPAGDDPSPVLLPPRLQAVELRNSRLRRPTVAPTFHARDIFGPAAAHLSRGVALDQFGPPVASILALPAFRARRLPGGEVAARVVSIDRFGNIITDARSEDLPADTLLVSCRGHVARGLAQTYAGTEGLVALIGSAGFLELAVANGSAAALTGAAIGDLVEIKGEGSV